MMTMRKKTLGRDQRGTAVVEFAFVAPLLSVLMVGAVDISMAFGRKLNLEQAAHRAIEKVMQTSADETVEGTLKAEAALQAGVTTDKVQVTYSLECNQVRMGDPSLSCGAGQTESRYVEVTVSDRVRPTIPIAIAGLNGDGTFHISATAGMRTQ